MTTRQLSTLNKEYLNRAKMVNESILTPALKLLPARMDSYNARVQLLATGLQESLLYHTRQIRGPARGYWQFESGGGLRGIMNHASSKTHLMNVTQQLGLPWDRSRLFEAIEKDQVFAAVCARLLYWTDPRSLPQNNAKEAWDYYIRNWRPGKPHRHTWDNYYRIAQEAMK